MYNLDVTQLITFTGNILMHSQSEFAKWFFWRFNAKCHFHWFRYQSSHRIQLIITERVSSILVCVRQIYMNPKNLLIFLKSWINDKRDLFSILLTDAFNNTYYQSNLAFNCTGLIYKIQIANHLYFPEKLCTRLPLQKMWLKCLSGMKIEESHEDNANEVRVGL